jgi:hypothetical protein
MTLENEKGAIDITELGTSWPYEILVPVSLVATLLAVLILLYYHCIRTGKGAANCTSPETGNYSLGGVYNPTVVLK